MFHKAYRFRLMPTKNQAHALSRMAGARRWVWNWGLERKRAHYKETGRSISLAALCRELTALKSKPETAWLKEANSQALQQALRDLEQSFVRFFKRCARFPRFKSKKRDSARFHVPQQAKVANGKTYCPKIGWIRIRQSRQITEKIKHATFRRSADGKWYVSLMVEFEMPEVRPSVDPTKVIGVDLGLIDFATFSDDSRPIPAPKFFRKAQRKLGKAQRVLARRALGSKRRDKAKLRAAKIHQQIANQRGDFLHKLTTKLVDSHDAICIEDLSLRGLARTKLAKSFYDASMGEFRRQLEYKCLWNTKALVVIDRFFPSSKMCNACGALNNALTLADRDWSCVCGAQHKRDFLAACNIRGEGLRLLAEGHSDRLNARGRGVRLAIASSPG